MIDIRNLEVSYGKSKVVKDVSFRVEGGNILSIIGPNGSGKSSLIKSIIGLVKPSSGSIFFENVSRSAQTRAEGSIGYMPQSPSFPKNLTILELVDFFKKLEPFDEETFSEMYENLGLRSQEDKKIGSLSGGTKQKVNILQCFSSKKDIYLIDEPTASLDPYVSHILKELLRSKKKEGALLIFSTHILAEVEDVADRFLLLSDGSLLIDESPKEFLRKSGFESLQLSLMEFWNREYKNKR
ncbi:ABC transporter, ATP-binding protein [Leptospira broomii serovar Hurstbridge str. 5399]|uniref:ABC transporter, ATP-binding protein n=1 Tax=Leptospira broomii serovar Hurstbridge str. 5399 TaxID=1049789 RepID=T0FG34_9LEPT|nr:ABC transporter ATP-binding protein [Leptospira broomii]EQA46896.1 ABC transporter, ATP-binding protein [Leptospira broomii serovar Hurstbridge str. 5399]